MHAENINTNDYAYFGKRGKAKREQRQANRTDKIENKKSKRAVRIENRKATAENRRANAENKRSKAESRVLLANQGIVMPSELSGGVSGIASIFGKRGGNEVDQQQIEEGVPETFVKKESQRGNSMGSIINKAKNIGGAIFGDTRTQPYVEDTKSNNEDVTYTAAASDKAELKAAIKKEKIKKAIPFIVAGIVLVVIVVVVVIFKKKK